MKNKLKKYPLFLFLLPVFFVLHGYTENYDFVPVKDAALLVGIYFLSSFILLILFRLIYKNWQKAALMAFLIMCYHFFFGSMKDFLTNAFPGSFLTQYIFILPFSFCMIVMIFIILKRRKKPLQQFAYYLNLLFLLLILIDAIWLAGKTTNRTGSGIAALPEEFRPCTDCSKPDVYVIIADEYAGNKELKDIFHFDNSLFLTRLTERGFHVIPNSSSNYNYTPFSVASTLNMNYLDLQRAGKQPLLSYTYEITRNNKLLRFLQCHHYTFYNYSQLDYIGQPAHIQENFLPVKTRLITSQTFVSRLKKEMRYHLVTWLKLESETKKFTYNTRDNNKALFQLTMHSVLEKTKEPKFVLTHLMIPHYPYYFDKNGNEFPFETLHDGNQTNREHYIEYLQYGNKKILELLDHIIKNSSSPPVIVLMGDHGFRHFDNPVDPEYIFYNLAAVRLPGKNYSAFPDSLTNVNLIRTVLNTTFNQQLPYLKDTAIFMANP